MSDVVHRPRLSTGEVRIILEGLEHKWPHPVTLRRLKKKLRKISGTTYPGQLL